MQTILQDKYQMDRAALDAMVDELERHMPRMLVDQHAPPGFWPWFAGEAASIESNTCCKNDWLYVRNRLSAIVECVDTEAGQRQ
ncbi:MAG: hypothetical protein ABI858_00040 [Pseudoxanthomonas sp.]